MAGRMPNRTRSTNRARSDEVEDLEMQDETEEDAEVADEDEESDLAPALADERGVAPAVVVTKRPWYDNLPRWVPKYLRDALSELDKVTWPTPKEARDWTITVVVFSLAAAVVFGALDLLLTQGLAALTDRIVNH